MVVYTLEQHWEMGLRSTYRRCRFWQKKNHFFRWSSFWSWRVRKQAKLAHLGHRKPARIHLKADAPISRHCLVWILIQRHNWAIFLRERPLWRSLSGYVVLFTKIVEDDIGNTWFQQEFCEKHVLTQRKIVSNIFKSTY